MTRKEIPTELHPRLIIERVDDALEFYQEVFGAELIERFVDGDGVVVHAAIKIGGFTVSFAQQVLAWRLLGPTAIGGSPVLLHLTLSDPDAACKRGVARGAQMVIPIADRAYGKREGRMQDPFGHLWILSRPTEELSEDEIRRRLGDMSKK